MKLDEILKLLDMKEATFVSMPEEAWRKNVEESSADPSQKKELLDLSELEGPQGREIFFRNTLLETFKPASPDFSPPMNLGAIRRFLGGINQVQFLTMSSEEWKKCVGDKVLDRRNESGSTKELNDREAYLLSLAEINDRKQYMVNTLDKYRPLQKIANGTPANIAEKNEANPANVIAPQGSDSPLYVAAGDKSKERKENVKAIFKEYEKFMVDYYKSLPDDATGKGKYGTEKDFLKIFKPKETYFKSFEDLEKSEAFKGFSDATKALYKAQAGGFPMNIIILPFEKPENGTQFMDKIKAHIKPMPSAAKKEEAEKTEAATPPSSLPGTTPK